MTPFDWSKKRKRMMTDNPDSGRGYSYVVTIEQIRAYRAVSPEQKLQWLQDANEFLAKALTGKRREIWQKFRRGEI